MLRPFFCFLPFPTQTFSRIDRIPHLNAKDFSLSHFLRFSGFCRAFPVWFTHPRGPRVPRGAPNALQKIHRFHCSRAAAIPFAGETHNTCTKVAGNCTVWLRQPVVRACARLNAGMPPRRPRPAALLALSAGFPSLFDEVFRHDLPR